MGIDPVLRRASALVYVEDLESPSLSQQDSHHLAGVLRVSPGEMIIASDGAGRYRACSLADKRAAQTLRLEVSGPVRTAEPPHPRMVVGFSLVKGDRSDWAVQKLSELGADRIIPLLCERTVVRPDVASATGRHRRLLRVAKEASMQARRVAIPEVMPITTFEKALDEIFAEEPKASVFLADPGGEDPLTLKEELTVMLVGPEGGWSEVELARAAARVCLGSTVQRTETAAITAGALVAALRAGVVAPACTSPPAVAKG